MCAWYQIHAVNNTRYNRSVRGENTPQCYQSAREGLPIVVQTSYCTKIYVRKLLNNSICVLVVLTLVYNKWSRNVVTTVRMNAHFFVVLANAVYQISKRQDIFTCTRSTD